MNNKIIELKSLTKNFDDQQVLKGIDLNIYENEFLTLLGPSGCGKTTILRIIAGFEEPSKCEVLFNGIDISKVHNDCGMMIYNREKQDVHAGGSGCGCSASVLCGYILDKVRRGIIKNVLFAATGALMSTTVVQQGESIPGISHAVHISYDCGTEG